MPPRSTGLPRADARDDFVPTRRRGQLARLVAFLRREPDDVNMMLPYDEVVQALGRVGRKSLGVQPIPLDSIVGNVGRTRDFDRSFRPASSNVRARWDGTQRLVGGASRSHPSTSCAWAASTSFATATIACRWRAHW
jgi:hypothetical protein